MAVPADLARGTYQARFWQRWGHLRQPHVRALAWLLDAPDLLDLHHPQWQGRIATLGAASAATQAWLTALDRDPSALDAELGTRHYTRLGLYAEKLMAFYFRQQGRLVAHGLQVRAARNDTVGEFDFLLEAGAGGVEHIEFATKFYLLEEAPKAGFDGFVGPNLADSLGAKMRKIFERQLALGQHPAAQAVLTQPVLCAHALVKGWLFYPLGTAPARAGITAGHCHGFWCSVSEIDRLGAASFVMLPRLEWLAPYRGSEPVLDGKSLEQALRARFDAASMPVLVARAEQASGEAVETARGFIVPDDWRAKASAKTGVRSDVSTVGNFTGK